MKSNAMLVGAIVAIAVLFALAGALYGASATLFPGARPAISDATGAEPVDNATEPEGPWSAFEAINVSSDSEAVQGWMAGKKAVYVAGVSSDFCTEGLSDAWTITYASDDGQIMACVVAGASVEARASKSSPRQGLDLAEVIDSGEAWQAAAAEVVMAGDRAPDTVSMSLKIVGGKPRWDVSYKASEGYRIVRVDASNGTVCDSTTVGQG